MGIASEIDCAACDTVLLKLVLHLARSVVALVVYIPLSRLLPGQPLSVNRCSCSYHISLIVKELDSFSACDFSERLICEKVSEN